MREFTNPSIEAVFEKFPDSHKTHLLQLRELILDTAETLELPGGIEETLKWGEPSYLPIKPKQGSTVRINRLDDDNVGLFFNCQTLLVESFRSMYGDELSYSKDRALVFSTRMQLPEKIIVNCTKMALRYHLDKR